MRALGWTSVTMLNRYTHINDSDVAEAFKTGAKQAGNLENLQQKQKVGKKRAASGYIPYTLTKQIPFSQS